MNVIAIRLVSVGTKSGLIVMCKILMVVVAFFIYACTLILLSLAATAHLDLSSNSRSHAARPYSFLSVGAYTPNDNVIRDEVKSALRLSLRLSLRHLQRNLLLVLIIIKFNFAYILKIDIFVA